MTTLSAEDLWESAYSLHYRDEDLEAAAAAYKSVLADYPKSEQARWAEGQLNIIANLSDYDRAQVSRRRAESQRQQKGSEGEFISRQSITNQKSTEDFAHVACNSCHTDPPHAHVADSFWVHKANEQCGPYTLAQLQNMWRNGLVTQATLYWQHGFEEWFPLSTMIESLESQASARMPPQSQPLRQIQRHQQSVSFPVVPQPLDCAPSVNQIPVDPIEKAAKHIKRAWIAAVVSGSVMLVVVLVTISGTQIMRGLDAWAFLDVVILFGFAFGIYKRSRTCAILLTAYAFVNECYMIANDQKPSPLRLIFIYYFFRGILATFAYHKLSTLISTAVTALPLVTPKANIPPPSMQRLYHVGSDGQDLGDISLATIKQMLLAGKLTTDDYYFDHETNEWLQLSRLSDAT